MSKTRRRCSPPLHDVLKPDGYLSFSTPSGWMWRRPGIFSTLAVARAQIEPRLRQRRRPLDIAVGIAQASSWYRRMMLRPEKNWREALPHHPALQPRIIRQMLEQAGFEIVLRTSSLWHLDPRYSLMYRRQIHREAGNGPRAAHRWLHWLMLLEALMNLVAPLRIFESRQLFLARRR